MKDKMNYLRELLSVKENNIKDDVDRVKIENLKFLLSKDDVFFNLDVSTAIGILAYLGVPEDKIKDMYFELISPESFMSVSKPYFTTGRM